MTIKLTCKQCKFKFTGGTETYIRNFALANCKKAACSFGFDKDEGPKRLVVVKQAQTRQERRMVRKQERQQAALLRPQKPKVEPKPPAVVPPKVEEDLTENQVYIIYDAPISEHMAL
jgi:hypothetical protein